MVHTWMSYNRCNHAGGWRFVGWPIRWEWAMTMQVVAAAVVIVMAVVVLMFLWAPKEE